MPVGKSRDVVKSTVAPGTRARLQNPWLALVDLLAGRDSLNSGICCEGRWPKIRAATHPKTEFDHPSELGPSERQTDSHPNTKGTA